MTTITHAMPVAVAGPEAAGHKIQGAQAAGLWRPAGLPA
jgi:hypothetical protein